MQAIQILLTLCRNKEQYQFQLRFLRLLLSAAVSINKLYSYDVCIFYFFVFPHCNLTLLVQTSYIYYKEFYKKKFKKIMIKFTVRVQFKIFL